MMYRTGMKAVDYVLFCESLAIYHGETLLKRKGFLENLLLQDGAEFLQKAQAHFDRLETKTS